MNISAAQLTLLNHTLGLSEWNRTPNRNYFITGESSRDFAGLISLVDAGMMTKQPNAEWLGGGFFFAATDQGREYAIDMLPESESSKKKSRYQEYRSSECCETFAEWLGIEVPKREYSRRYNWHEPENCVRLTSSLGTGEWAKTLKEAKVSYKAAIKRARDERKAWEKSLGIGAT